MSAIPTAPIFDAADVDGVGVAAVLSADVDVDVVVATHVCVHVQIVSAVEQFCCVESSVRLSTFLGLTHQAIGIPIDLQRAVWWWSVGIGGPARFDTPFAKCSELRKRRNRACQLIFVQVDTLERSQLSNRRRDRSGQLILGQEPARKTMSALRCEARHITVP